MKELTKKSVQDYVRARLKKDKKWALRALLVIYDRQTQDEKRHGNTLVYNNVGFSGNDAEFLSSLAQQYRRKGYLTERQIQALMKKIHRYSRQIVEKADKKKLHALVINARDTQMNIPAWKTD